MAKILKSVTVNTETVVPVGAIKKEEPVVSEEVSASTSSLGGQLRDTLESEPEPEAEVALTPTEAQQHVEMMLGQAQLQVATWQEEARQTGWEAGHEQGQKAAEQKLAAAIQKTQEIASAAVSAKEKLLADSQAELSKLAIAIAKKIIGKELSVNPKVVSDIVARAIKLSGVKGACCIRVHPADYEILGPLWDAIPSFQQPSQAWELVADDSVSRGGCLIDIDGGTIDGQIETQVAQITATFDDIDDNVA